MDISIGLPNTVPGASGAQLLEWARRAEHAGFSSLASIGAVSYPGYEELTVFAAAGARPSTSRRSKGYALVVLCALDVWRGEGTARSLASGTPTP